MPVLAALEITSTQATLWQRAPAGWQIQAWRAANRERGDYSSGDEVRSAVDVLSTTLAALANAPGEDDREGNP